MADDIKTLIAESEKLNILLKSRGKQLTKDHIATDIKIFQSFHDKVNRQLSGTDSTDLDLWTLIVSAGTSIPLDYVTYVDSHTSKWLYPVPHYFPQNDPATNYATVWSFTYDASSGADIVRPYIMPGLTTTADGATVHLHSIGTNIWGVKFQTVASPHLIYRTSIQAGYVGLYVKEGNDDVYLVPHNAVDSTTTETDIVGTLLSNVSNVHVWRMESVLKDYIFPVPELPEEGLAYRLRKSKL